MHVGQFVAVRREQALAPRQAGVHQAGGEFGVELHRQRARAVTQHLVRIVRRAGQHRRGRGRPQHALLVRQVRQETVGQARQQRIGGRGGQALNRMQADFAAARVIVDHAAERVRHQLMAIADA